MRSAAFYLECAGHAVLIAIMLFPLQTAFGREAAREQVTTFLCGSLRFWASV